MSTDASIDGVKTEIFLSERAGVLRFEPGQLPSGSAVYRHVTVAPLLSPESRGQQLAMARPTIAGLNVETSSGKSGKA
jgi:hypothetical protein